MKTPDIILAALAVKGVLSIEEAQELSKLYHRKPTYDDPVPINFDSALDYVGPMLDAIAEDRGVDELLHRRPVAGPVVGYCDDCGQPVDKDGNVVEDVPRGPHGQFEPDEPDDDDDQLSEHEIEGMFALWNGLQTLVRHALN